MQLLTEQMGVNHHVTRAYCPWANGSVEIVGKELPWTARAVLSELGYSATDWTLVLPLFNFILNHREREREREVLNSRTPIEVMTGSKPKAPNDLVLWDGVLLKDTNGMVVEWKRVDQYCDRLAKALDRTHYTSSCGTLARSDAESTRRKQRMRAADCSSRWAIWSWCSNPIHH